MSNHLRRPHGKRNSRPTPKSTRSRLFVQSLEDRTVPTNFVVSNTLDDGSAGSLRGAINQANLAAGADTITFSALFNTPQTITLNGTELSITDDVTITGSGTAGTAPTTIVSGGGLSRVIHIENAASVLNVTLSGFIVQDGVTTTAIDGSGVFTSDEAVTFDRMVIRNNSNTGTTTTRSGGGVAAGSGVANLAAGGSSLTFRNSTISGNSTSGRGGGIYFLNSGSLFMENCTVSGNTSRNTLNGGGGIYFYGTPGPAGFTIRNSTLQGNSALAGQGGAIQLYYLNGTAVIQNCTITGNTAGSTSTVDGSGGGGISNYAQVTGEIATIIIQSSIISGNSANAANGHSDIAVQPSTVVNIDHSAIGSSSGFTYTDPTGTNLPLGSNLNLGNLQSNGGPTFTIALAANSLALNAGSNPAVPPLTTDQRGFPRSQNGGIDIGAFELDASVPTASTTLTNVVTSVSTPYAFQVTYVSTAAPIDLSTLDDNDLLVTGPNGFSVNPTRGTINSSNPNSVVVDYSFAPPGGSWELADNGTYSVAVVADQVRNTNNTAVPAGSIGTFQTLIAGTFHVTTTNDSGAGSLRDALAQANQFSTADTIVFDSPVFGTTQAFITLASALPSINQPLILTGPGAGLLTVRRDSPAATQFRIFTISAATTISGVTATGGETEGVALGTRGGGGVSVGAGQSLTMTDSVISGNSAAGEGGGFYVGSGGSLTLQRCTVSGNTSGTDVAFIYGTGGGIYMRDGGTLLVDSCTISGNTSPTNGGGIYLYGNTAPPSNFVISNSTIFGNTAGGTGGGVHLNSPSGTHVATIQSSTIVGNTAQGVVAGQGGGGVANQGVNTINILSSVIAFNNTTVPTSPAPDVLSDATAITSATNSLIRDQTGATIVDNGGNLAAGTDPLFVGGSTPTLTNNGGPTNTIALQTGSPLINAGQATLPGIPFDQRGSPFVRVSGAASDIGAFEVQPAGVAPTVTGTQINGGASQRSRTTTLAVTFSAQVTFAGAIGNAFTLTRNGGGAVSFTATAAVVGGVTVVTLDAFTGAETTSGSLNDGNYTLTALANQISVGGTNMAANYVFGAVPADNLYRFYGDVNGDRRVDIADFGIFSLAYLNPANYNTILDYNQDNRIDIADFGQFSVRYFTTLP